MSNQQFTGGEGQETIQSSLSETNQPFTQQPSSSTPSFASAPSSQPMYPQTGQPYPFQPYQQYPPQPMGFVSAQPTPAFPSAPSQPLQSYQQYPQPMGFMGAQPTQAFPVSPSQSTQPRTSSESQQATPTLGEQTQIPIQAMNVSSNALSPDETRNLTISMLLVFMVATCGLLIASITSTEWFNVKIRATGQEIDHTGIFKDCSGSTCVDTSQGIFSSYFLALRGLLIADIVLAGLCAIGLLPSVFKPLQSSGGSMTVTSALTKLAGAVAIGALITGIKLMVAATSCKSYNSALVCAQVDIGMSWGFYLLLAGTGCALIAQGFIYKARRHV